MTHVFDPGRPVQSSPSYGLGVGSRTAACPSDPCLCPPSLLLWLRMRRRIRFDQWFSINFDELSAYIVQGWHVAGVDQLVGGDSAERLSTLSSHVATESDPINDDYVEVLRT